MVTSKGAAPCGANSRASTPVMTTVLSGSNANLVVATTGVTSTLLTTGFTTGTGSLSGTNDPESSKKVSCNHVSTPAAVTTILMAHPSALFSLLNSSEPSVCMALMIHDASTVSPGGSVGTAV